MIKMKKYYIVLLILFMSFASYVKADDLSEYFNVGDIKACDSPSCDIVYDEENGCRAGSVFLVKFTWNLHSSKLIKNGDTVTIPFTNSENTETTTVFGGTFSWTDIYDENNDKIGQWMLSGTSKNRKISIKFSDNAVGKTDISGTFVTTKNLTTRYTYVDKIVPLKVGNKNYRIKVNTYNLPEASNHSAFHVSSTTNNTVVLQASSPRITAKQLYNTNNYSELTNEAILNNLYFEFPFPTELNGTLNRIVPIAMVYLPTNITDHKASYYVSNNYTLDSLQLFTEVSQNENETYEDFKNRLTKYEYGIYKDGDNKIVVINFGNQPSLDLTYKHILNIQDISEFEPGDYGNLLNPFTIDSQTKEVINNLAGSQNKIQGKVFSWGLIIHLDFPTVRVPTTKQMNGTWSWENGNGEVKTEQQTVDASLIVPSSIADVSGASQLLLRDKDSKNEITGAGIKLQKKNGDNYEDIAETLTDSSGYAIFTNLESGTYRYVQTSYLDHYQNDSFTAYADINLSNELQTFEFDKSKGNIIYATNEKEKFNITYLPGEHGNFTNQIYNEIPYGSATPIFNPTGEDDWLFVGWSPEVNPFVVKNQTYTALWKKLVKVTTKYLEYGTDIEISDDVLDIDDDGTPYTTEKKEFYNYEYVTTIGDESGTRGEEDIVVKYYYKKKEANLNIKYLDCRTRGEIASSTNVNVYYGDLYNADNYEINVNILQNYNRVAAEKSENYKGVVSNDNINVEYCYNKKDSNINADISLTGTDSITSSKDTASYDINYNAYFTDYIGPANIVLVDTLPYKIDVHLSNLDGGIYDENTKTITWIINTDINSYNNNKYSINKNIDVTYIDINAKENVMVDNVTGNLTADEKFNSVNTNYNTYININGTLTINYLENNTNKELSEKIITTDKVGAKYEIDFKEIEGYNLIEKPDNKIYEYKEGSKELKLIYDRIKFNIITNVLSEGGEISGDEEVLYGDDSTKDLIKIKAQDGYYIKEVLINDKIIEIPEKQTELIIPNFTNMKEDKKIDVSFEKSDNKVIVPNTLKKTYLVYIGIIITICGLISVAYILYKKKVIFRK